MSPQIHKTSSSLNFIFTGIVFSASKFFLSYCPLPSEKISRKTIFWKGGLFIKFSIFLSLLRRSDAPFFTARIGNNLNITLLNLAVRGEGLMRRNLVFFALLIVLILGGSALYFLRRGHAVSDERVWIKYQPMQCESTPWMTWYATGAIKFFKQPTDGQIIIAYYANLYNITLSNYSTVMNPPDSATCQACHVCPTQSFMKISAPSSALLMMERLGWQKM